MQRAEHDEFEDINSLKAYEKMYENAVKFLREQTELKIIELDVSKTTKETIAEVKEILKNENYD